MDGARPQPSAELWLERGDRCCRLVLLGLTDAEIEQARRGLAFALAPHGVPDCVALLRRTPEGIEAWLVDEHSHLRVCPNVSAAVGALVAALGWVALDLLVLVREERALLVGGDAAAPLAAALAMRGWCQLSVSAALDADRRCLCAGSCWLERALLIRASARSELGAHARLVAADAAEVSDWLAEAARLHAPVTPALIEAIAGSLVPMRAYFGASPAAAAAAAAAIQERLAGQQTAAPPEVRCRRSPVLHERALAAGSARARVLAYDLTAEALALLDYATAALAPPSGETAPARPGLPLLALRPEPAEGPQRPEGGAPSARAWRAALSLWPQQILDATGPSVASLLGVVDFFAQRLLLDNDCAHTILLGSAVARAGSLVCLLGDRRAGKSSLALRLMRELGFVHFGDDFLLFDPAARLWRPFPKPLRLGGAAHALLPEDLARGGRAVPPTTKTGACWLFNPLLELGQSAPEAIPEERATIVACAFDPELPGTEAAILEPLRAGELQRVLSLALMARSATAAAVARLSEKLRGYRLRFRDHTAAAATVATLAVGSSRRSCG